MNNLIEVYEEVLKKHNQGYLAPHKRDGKIVDLLVFYPVKIVRQLTGKSPKQLEKWIAWHK